MLNSRGINIDININPPHKKTCPFFPWGQISKDFFRGSKFHSKDKALLVSTSALRFEYDEVVLKSVDLEFRAGRCMGMVGLNASGKTTLARAWAFDVDVDGTVDGAEILLTRWGW